MRCNYQVNETYSTVRLVALAAALQMARQIKLDWVSIPSVQSIHLRIH